MSATASADNGASLAASRHEANGDPDFMASLSRGLSVIRAFSEHRRQVQPRTQPGVLNKRAGFGLTTAGAR